MTRRVVVSSIAAIAAGTSVLCWTNLHSAAEARAVCRSLAEQQMTIGRELQQRTEQANGSATKSVATSRGGATLAAPKDVNPVTTPHKPPPDASTLMAQNPALRDLFQRYTRAKLGFQFRPFYHAANLTPEMIARFQALILEQKQEEMDLASASAASELTPAEEKRVRADQLRQHETQLRQLLGDGDYTKYQEFTRIEPMEAAIGTVAKLGAETGEPLTEAQGERLLTILANNSRSYQNGGKANVWTLDLPQLLIQAEPILSPHQFAVLRGDADLARAFKLAEQYQTTRSKQETGANPASER